MSLGYAQTLYSNIVHASNGNRPDEAFDDIGDVQSGVKGLVRSGEGICWNGWIVPKSFNTHDIAKSEGACGWSGEGRGTSGAIVLADRSLIAFRISGSLTVQMGACRYLRVSVRRR